MKRFINTIALSLSLAALISLNSGCKTVSRVEPDRQIDLSGRWNDTDSRLVAEEMIKDALGRQWLNRFQQKNSRNPVVIVGSVSNKSHEHIEPSTFIKDMEKEFINSGAIRVVQNSQFREKVRQERADQQTNASLETLKKFGLEMGADYMMFGTINSIVDQEGRKKVVFYQINVELTDMETNEIVWMGDKKIKKYVVN